MCLLNQRCLWNGVVYLQRETDGCSYHPNYQHHQVNDHLRPVLAQPQQLGHLHLKGDVATNVVQQLVIGRVDCGRFLFGPGEARLQNINLFFLDHTLTTIEVMEVNMCLPVVHPHDDVLHALVAINRKGRVTLYSLCLSSLFNLTETKTTSCPNKTNNNIKLNINNSQLDSPVQPIQDCMSRQIQSQRLDLLRQIHRPKLF